MRKFVKSGQAQKALAAFQQQVQELSDQQRRQEQSANSPHADAEEIIRQKLSHLIPSIEKFRQQKYRQLKIRKTIVLLFLLVLVAIGMKNAYPFDMDVLLNVNENKAFFKRGLDYAFGIAMIASVFGCWLHAPAKQYFLNVKKQILPTIIEAYNPDFRYEFTKQTGASFKSFFIGETVNKQKFPEAAILGQSGIVYQPRNIEEARQDDRLSGVYKNVRFTFVELNGGQQYSRDDYKYSDGFFLLTFDQPFEGHTLAISDKDKYEKMLSKGRSEFANAKFERVVLEDPAFERVFEVYGTHQQEARYILSPSMMERLRTLKFDTSREDTKVQAAFFDHYAVIYLTYYDNLLEPPNINVPVTDIDSVVHMLHGLDKICSIIDELNIALFANRRAAAAKMANQINGE